MLAWELSKPLDKHGHPDMLHLNRSGAKLLAGLIKQSIFTRLHGGVNRRRHTGRFVSEELYSHVTARGLPAPQQSGSADD